MGREAKGLRLGYRDGVKLLTFQARRFGWQTFSKTLDDADDADVAKEVANAVVAFMHVEKSDEGEARASTFRQTLKHIKWIANKRQLKTVVLHSFTHLGGDHADAGIARSFIDELAERLENTGYAVERTPFGYFCAWQLDVFGDSLAKVFKQIG
jgi:hypothetical protein